MMDNIADDKKRLIDSLKIQGFLKTKKIEGALKSVPREQFVLPKEKEYAYADVPQDIGYDQTISAPHMVALMTGLLKPKSSDKVLEVGSGSGYQAAVLAKLVNQVFSVELVKELADFAASNLERTGIKNVETIHGDGSKGLSEHAPYDKIIVTCACSEVPKALFGQLKEGGLLVAPVGGPWQQDLRLFRKTRTRQGRLAIEGESHGACVFVPLRH